MRLTPNTVTDGAVGFDGLRAVVGAGEGVVGRFPGIVCVARCSDPEPLREFLAVCSEVAGPEPGRPLARRLATWMSGPDAPGPELRFGTVATAGDKLAVYLVGDVEARVDAVGGLSLSGAHAAIGTDRLLPPPTSPVVLSMDGGGVRADPADVHDLRGGVVPGAGVVLRPTGFGLDELRHAEDGADGVHEWFDTGKDATDSFGDPPRSPDVPVQRAPAVGVGGRNGVAREAGAQAVDEREAAEDGSAGPGRHALDLPLPPPPPQARVDPLTDPLPDDVGGDDPPRRPRPAPAGGGQGEVDAPRPPSSTSRDGGQPSDPIAWEGGAPR